MARDTPSNSALTTSVDTIPGLIGSNGTSSTAGNDVVLATYIGATGSTLNPGDNLNLGLGINSMDLTATSDGNIVGFTVNNIQNYNIRNFGSSTSDTTLTFIDGAPGIKSVNLTGSDADGDTVVSGVGTIVTASMANGTGDLTLSYNHSVVTGLSDNQTLTVSNLTGGSFTALGIETLNIVGGAVSSTGFSVSSNNNTLNTVNINAVQALGLTVAETNVTAVNGAASTGALTLTVDTVLNAGAASITGGSGNDVFIVAAKLGSTDVINGGAGTNTLTLTGGLTAANAVGVTNIQVVKAVDAAASSSAVGVTVDTDAIASATTFQAAQLGFLTTTAADATITFSNFANTDNLQIIDGNARSNTTVTHKTDTTSNVLTASIAGLGVKAVTANEAETVNLASNANTLGTVTANTIADGNFTDATSFVVTGAADLTLTDLAMVASSGGSFSTFNSSAATGKQTVTFSTGGDQSIIGGSANDSISLVAETLNSTDVIDLGGGTNTLTASVDGVLGNLNISNVNTLNLSTKASSPNDTSLNIASNTALSVLNVDFLAGDSDTFQVSGIKDGTTSTLKVSGSSNAAETQGGKVTLNYTVGSALGSVVLQGDSDASNEVFTEVAVANVVTLNLSGATNPAILSTLTGDNNLTSLNIRGASAVAISASGSTTNLATINASTATGVVGIGAGVARTTTAVITGGTGADNIGLNINTQSSNTIDAGSGEDSLTLVGTSNAAVTVVDLSSTTDQLVSINGTVNLAVQKGFENLDASGLSTSTGFGVQVTAGSGTKSVTTTAQADVVTGNASAAAAYVLGAGADVFTGTAANETITGGTGGDTINLGTGTDTLIYTEAAQTFEGNVTSGTTALTGVDIITGAAAADVLSIFAGAQITSSYTVTTAVITAGTGTAIATVLGNFAESTGVWTSSATGTSTLIQWDSNGATSAGTIQNVVLSGVQLTATTGTNLIILAAI